MASWGPSPWSCPSAPLVGERVVFDETSWGPVEALLGLFYGHRRALLARLAAFFGPLRTLMGRVGALLGRLRGLVGSQWSIFGLLPKTCGWSHQNAVFDETTWGPVEALLGPSWGLVELSWPVLKPSWAL